MCFTLYHLEVSFTSVQTDVNYPNFCTLLHVKYLRFKKIVASLSNSHVALATKWVWWLWFHNHQFSVLTRNIITHAWGYKKINLGLLRIGRVERDGTFHISELGLDIDIDPDLFPVFYHSHSENHLEVVMSRGAGRELSWGREGNPGRWESVNTDLCLY